MLNLISCELLKLKRSKMVLISVAGVLSTPLLMLIEALQTHFDKPEIIFTLSDIYSDSVLYISKRSIASTFCNQLSSAIIVSHYTQSKKFST